MYASFDDLPEHSRTWVYQSNRFFTTDEEEYISSALKKFCQNWKAHDQALMASFHIAYHRFIILVVDEDVHTASGCSIDSSVRAIREIQAHINADLFNRDIALLLEDQVYTYSIAEAKEKIAANQFLKNTIVFNNAIMKKSELSEKWQQPLTNSWLAKYLPKPTVLV